MSNAIIKKCSRCNESKALSDYYHNKTKKDNHNGICKNCQGEVDKINREKIILYQNHYC